jgi:hypothetical protein
MSAKRYRNQKKMLWECHSQGRRIGIPEGARMRGVLDTGKPEFPVFRGEPRRKPIPVGNLLREGG